MKTRKLSLDRWDNAEALKDYLHRLRLEAEEQLDRCDREQRGLSIEEELGHGELVAEIKKAAQHLDLALDREARRPGGPLSTEALFDAFVARHAPETRSTPAAAPRGPSLGRLITQHPAFAGLRAAGRSAPVGFDIALERRAITGTICGGLIVAPPVPPAVVPYPSAGLTTPLRVSDLLRHTAEGAAPCTYPVYGARTGSAGVVAPGAPKPDIGVAITFTPASYVKVAGHVVVNDEILEDDAAAGAAIDQELVYDLLDAIDAEVLTGPGGAGRMLGLVPGSGGPDTVKGATEPPTAALIREAGLLADASSVPPDSVVMNYKTAAASSAVLAADSGVFVAGLPTLGAPAWTGGLRLAISAAMADGTALVGSFARGAALVSKNMIRVERSSGGDFFIANQTVLRIEQRSALCLMRPLSFGLVTGMPTGA
jgi:HK97 family phage major capsid protein